MTQDKGAASAEGVEPANLRAVLRMMEYIALELLDMEFDEQSKSVRTARQQLMNRYSISEDALVPLDALLHYEVD